MEERARNVLIGLALLAVAFVIAYFFIFARPQPKPVQIDVEGRHWQGAGNASAILIEFSDFQCPYCGLAAANAKEVAAEFNSSVKFYYLHFPLPFHQYAQKAAEAAECAGDQGKFWEMHDLMFANQDSLDIESLRLHASSLGLNMTRFNSCLDSGEKAAIVQADFDKGRAAGVGGTPTFFLNGLQLGSYEIESLRAAIRAELGK